jgi:hypothetical protein
MSISNPLKAQPIFYENVSTKIWKAVLVLAYAIYMKISYLASLQINYNDYEIKK